MIQRHLAGVGGSGFVLRLTMRHWALKAQNARLTRVPGFLWITLERWSGRSGHRLMPRLLESANDQAAL